jgi:hypothetical protein
MIDESADAAGATGSGATTSSFSNHDRSALSSLSARFAGFDGGAAVSGFVARESFARRSSSRAGGRGGMGGGVGVAAGGAARIALASRSIITASRSRTPESSLPPGFLGSPIHPRLSPRPGYFVTVTTVRAVRARMSG